VPAPATPRPRRSTVEAGAAAAPSAEGPLASVSGGRGSLLPRERLDAEGRRFLDGAVPGEEARRVLGVPTAMNPIRVYAGLGSAPSPLERVQLALTELERLGALERRRIVVACPTGMGFLNPVAVEAEELMSAGDVATVVVQYGNRRSWRTRRRVPVGRETHRLLLDALAARLRSTRGPVLAIYAESLGAWAALAALDGPEDLHRLGVGRGLWVGVPYDGRRHEQRVAPPGHDGFVRVGSAAELETLPPARFTFLTRPDDPVHTFEGPRTILAPPRERRPSGAWVPVLSFARAVREIARATDFTPGRLDSAGHDYRGELAAAIRSAFGHTGEIDASTLTRVQDELLAREQRRAGDADAVPA